VQKIGLFPLGMVIFPGSSVPLHIFEPRYKQLVKTTIEEHTVFGVNLVNAEKLHQIGCTVAITDVQRVYDDGRMDIVVTGKQRFFLQSMYEGSEPYYVGVIRYFEDTEITVNDILQRQCIALHNEIISLVYPGGSGGAFHIDDSATEQTAFRIAQKAGLDLEKKQKLLEMRSENQRLEFVHMFMHDILPDLRRRRRLQEVIAGDGYLPMTPSKE
jgi:ATP-dependent Lon protease